MKRVPSAKLQGRAVRGPGKVGRAILRELDDWGAQTVDQLAIALEVELFSARNALSTLRQRGLVEVCGTVKNPGGRGGLRKLFCLTDAAVDAMEAEGGQQ